MRLFRIIITTILIVSTVLLVTLIADFKFSGNEYEVVTMVALQTMHISLLLSAILYIMRYFKDKDYFRMIVTIVPFVALVLSIVLSVFGIAFSSMVLLLFDMYLIVWFSILLSEDVKKN